MASAPISLPQADTPQERYQRERNLAGQRSLYEWQYPPGLPPVCKGIPAPEEAQARTASNRLISIATPSLRRS